MAKVAFCGLGLMGEPMARRILAGGHDLTVWNRTASKADGLREAGAAVASSPADAARGAEAAITMLADPAALEDVVFGPDGVAEALAPGSALIEMSTIGPDAARDVAGRLPEGVDLVDAPVRGSVGAARDGTLKILVGASGDAFARWRPLLETMGAPTHAGPVGSGAAMKLVNNFAVLSLTSILGDALVLADAMELDTTAVLDMLADTPLGAAVGMQREKIETGRYPTAFKLGLARKDVGLALEAVGARGRRLRVGEAVHAALQAAEADGRGDHDHAAVIGYLRGRPTG
jgi:3-hydroxyisobutyrate dehydrogenase-like beta-hydroxyacid dehydrogenase